MHITKATVLLAFLLFFGSAATVFSAPVLGEEDTRYFVQSTRSFWKSTLSARHVFEDGFTADLSEWQFRFAKIAGLKIYPVKKLNILPVEQVVLGITMPDEIPVVSSVPVPLLSPVTTPDAGGHGVLDVEIFGKSVRQLLSRRPVPVEQIPWGIKMIYNNNLLESVSGGKDVKVAILDTGIFADHPDLKDHIVDCKDFSQIKTPLVNGKCEDKNGHGTHVAGVIGANGGADGLGVYGVAPDASLMAYKVCSNSGTCWSDDIATAIRIAADAGAQVINLSLGSDSPSSLIRDAVVYAVQKGSLVVAAAGNDGPYQESIDYPGAFTEVVAVAALDGGRIIPDWSSQGGNSLTKPFVVEEKDIELAAPGVNVESTWKDGGYAILSGTSMASPHIAGLAAKIWLKDAKKPAEATRQLLHDLASDIFPEGDDDASGWGLPSL